MVEKIYRIQQHRLEELLEMSGLHNEAKLLIPDLQRPFVWEPPQVVLLIDSLIRGWPFGTLILWEVKHSGLDVDNIPHRPFWRIVSRVDDIPNEPYAKGLSPHSFWMLLDGQQRIQSLLLAVGVSSGFTLYDREWADVLEKPRPTAKYWRNYWSSGTLCLNIEKFLDNRIKQNKNVLQIDYPEVLDWVVCRADGMSQVKRPSNYLYPIKSFIEEVNRGKFIPFSLLWNMAKPGKYEDEYGPILEKELLPLGIDGEKLVDVKRTLPQLLVTLASIKQTEIACLQLEPFNKENISQEEEKKQKELYDYTIVTIFTRLNKAGTELTDQEVTFAWIKRQWNLNVTKGLSADKCFEELQKRLNSYKISIKMDQLVRAVSIFWSAIFNSGQLLEPKDLLNGKKLMPLAEEINKHWDLISESIEECCRIIQDKKLEYRQQYDSINSLIVLWVWHMIAMKWIRDRESNLSVLNKDAYNKTIEETLIECSDRWLILTNWAGRWRTANYFEEYIKRMYKEWNTIDRIPHWDKVAKSLKNLLYTWLDELKESAKSYIEELSVSDRNYVHQYYIPLWVWHRLHIERWNNSKIPLRDTTKKGTKKFDIDVDHIVSCDFWMKNCESSIHTVALGQGQFNDSPINEIGNMLLLEKNFNISKGSDTLKNFVQGIYEFKEGKLDLLKWREALLIDDPLYDPVQSSCEEIQNKIIDRTKKIKEELYKYVDGSLKIHGDGKFTV